MSKNVECISVQVRYKFTKPRVAPRLGPIESVIFETPDRWALTFFIKFPYGDGQVLGPQLGRPSCNAGLCNEILVGGHIYLGDTARTTGYTPRDCPMIISPNHCETD
jgi:hypothetical protein